MKNIIKSISLLLVLTLTVSCDKDSSEDLGYAAQEERGWVQFMEDSPSEITGFIEEGGVVELDVNIQVPTTSSDLSINYNLVSVAGDDPNNYFSNSGTVIAPAGKTSYSGPDNDTGFEYNYLAMISFDIAELNDVTLTGPMTFDVELTGTSSSQITAGLEGETFKVIQRVTIVQISSLAGTYSVTEPQISLSAIFEESYQVELANDASSPLVLSATNSDGFDTYFFSNTTMTLGNGGAVLEDAAADAGAIVALADAFVFDATDVLFGNDSDGNTTISFGANSGVLYYNDLAYSLVLTKM